MISWIQKTFQQHFRTIFLVLLGLVIVSFVFSFGPSSGLNSANSKVVSRAFFDLNLSAPDDQQRLMGDASLSVTLQAGYDALQAEQLQQYALQRYAALHLATRLDLPAPTTQEITAHVQTLRAFAGEDGKFDPKRYADFRDSLKTAPRLHESDVLRVLSDDVTYDRVQKLLSGPGYILPGDIKNQLTRADSLWTIAAITVDYATFKPAITPTDAELEKYFGDNAFRYEIAPKVSLAYLDFPSADFVSKVNVTDAEIRAHYDANPARFPKPAAAAKTPSVPAPAAAPASPDADYAAVRPQVEAALKLERAQRLAAETASDLSVALYEGKITPAGLDAFLAAKSLSLKSAAPFDHDNVPAELAGTQVADEAFKLGADRPVSDVVTTARGAAILVWKATIPAAKPAFAAVKPRVLADYVENEKRSRFVAFGKTLRATLEARLKAGAPLEKALEAARATTTAKIDLKTYPAFTLSTPPKDIDYSLYGALETLEKGRLSEMVISGDKGVIAYAADKKLPDLDPAGAKFTETRTKLAAYTAKRDANDYLREIVEQELAKSAPSLAQ